MTLTSFYSFINENWPNAFPNGEDMTEKNMWIREHQYKYHWFCFTSPIFIELSRSGKVLQKSSKTGILSLLDLRFGADIFYPLAQPTVLKGDNSLVQRVFCPKGHLSETYRLRIGLGLWLGLGLEMALGLGLASNFGICTTPFRTNDPSDKWPVTVLKHWKVKVRLENFILLKKRE